VHIVYKMEYCRGKLHLVWSYIW